MTQTVEDQTAAAWGDYGSASAWAPVVDALKRVDTRIAATLRLNESVIGQLRTCDWYGEGYPHPGCAEFGPPDHWDCGDSATHRIVWRSLMPDYMNGEPEFDGDDTEIGVTLSCAEHLPDMAKVDDQYAALLYVEVIDTGERVDVEQLRSEPTVSVS